MTDSEIADLAELTIGSFAGHVGERFTLEGTAGDHELALVECEPGGQSLHREAFSLTFLGPAEPVLAQQIHRLRHPQLGVLELFLVPVGADAGGTRYEAVFT